MYQSSAKKLYYYAESALVKNYYKKLPKNCMYACVSASDTATLQQMGLPNVHFVPIFPGWQQVTSQTGIGNLCLFHGNLSVPENEQAAFWLLNNVFTKVRVPFVIAGKNPSQRLQQAATLCQHTCLVNNPTEEEMNDLIQKAHINILPLLHTQVTGIRLKLLHALFAGRHCIVTPAMVAGSGLEDACYSGNNSSAVASLISQLYYQPFEEHEITIRKKLLCHTYNNLHNVDKFINYLW